MTKQKLLLYLNIILGLSIIVYIIYIRLIVTRLPKELYIYNENILSIKIIIIIIIGLIIAVFQLLLNSMILLNIGIRKSKLGEKLNHMNMLLDNAIFDIYNLIINKIPGAYNKISKICGRFYDIFSKYTEFLFTIIDYIIRTIILISFLVDVFLFFKLEFMYKALYLLLISLFLKVFIYMLKDIASNINILKEDLIVIHKGIDKVSNLPITSYSFRDINETADLNYHIKQYILCNKLSGYLEAYDQYRFHFNPYFNIMIYSLYLLGWSYVIYFNVIIFFL